MSTGFPAPSNEIRAAHAPAGLEAAKLVAPRSVAEACTLLADAVARKATPMILAGGTDLIVDRHLLPVERANKIDLVVDLTRIEGFHRITHDAPPGGGEARLRLGGGVTYWDLRKDPAAAAIPMLAEMARDVGAVQIQTRGTLAGNIASASPAADGVPVLMALEGNVHLANTSGTRTVPLEKFFTGYRKTVMQPGELIVEIDVRVPPRSAWARWRKVGTRLAQAISKVALASVVEVEGGTIRRARFGIASVAATTHPLAAVREYLEGRALAAVNDDELGAALAKDVTPIDDVRSTGEYRAHVARALVRRALEAPTAG